MKKTTDSFKEIIISNTIIPHLKWKGSEMRFPYTWNGNQRFAVIKLKDLIKAIKWDKEI